MVDDTAWTFVFAEQLGPDVRIRACVPAAIDERVARCSVLNVRTGDLRHVGELQLHIESIKAIKPKAHRLYDLLRSYGWEGESLSS